MLSAEVAGVGLTDAFAGDVRLGLTAARKHIPPRYFYDALGSALFAAICELPEYYVTRSEREILDDRAGEIAAAFDPPVERMIELGSGNAQKTRRIFEALLEKQDHLLYQPVDVDPASLDALRRTLSSEFPALTVRGVQGDFADTAGLGTIQGRTIILFLGSSIGNLDHRAAAGLLRGLRSILQSGDSLFVGFDLKKSAAILDPAYNDTLGVTASFNLNLLARINRELGGHFRLDRFFHRAFFNEAESRIEMHLISREAQAVAIDALGIEARFEAGESIHTENSYKYDEASIAALAAEAGLAIARRWTDARGWFADVLLRPA